ncbi:MAG: hypothetical protein A3J48_03285 [Candidatus Doudnabacteria bacterium RIFCSPHIGHO2_02_FULL_46_11]|uniref:ROK family protein n=1 Tax=Candidatus Doudnabacteria bacterium RIFCSPHIGHO2_02_FULL_46_11 TaxID=1817832 RepID=A0A1F5P8P6_9BACT|nr:MAG: hypothetical protein A3J48_03285 [Candidatus Doudnabacteria bacterium RIFCSPHIGHO2_02_FULL_46_11]
MVLVFDIGATSTRIARSQDGNTLSDIEVYGTVDDFEKELELFSRYQNEFLKGAEIKGVAGGLAGSFNKDKGSLFRCKTKSFINAPFKEKLAEIFAAPVFLENDAVVAGLGEAHFGASRGYHISAYLTISTGLGGAKIVDGRPAERTWGFEPGKQRVVIGDQLVRLEDYISGSAIIKEFGARASDIHDKAVWAEIEKRIALAINNTAVMWSPEIVVLGGGAVLDTDLDLAKVTAELEKILLTFPALPVLKKAELGDSAGLYGALKLLG